MHGANIRPMKEAEGGRRKTPDEISRFWFEGVGLGFQAFVFE